MTETENKITDAEHERLQRCVISAAKRLHYYLLTLYFPKAVAELIRHVAELKHHEEKAGIYE